MGAHYQPKEQEHNWEHNQEHIINLKTRNIIGNTTRNRLSTKRTGTSLVTQPGAHQQPKDQEHNWEHNQEPWNPTSCSVGKKHLANKSVGQNQGRITQKHLL